MAKRNLKQKKVANKLNIDEAKLTCAKFLGLPASKYSILEIVICVSAKLDRTVRGDLHQNQQIKHLASIINKGEKKTFVVNSTKKDFYSSRAWKILRYQVFELQGARCQCCGATAKDGISLHVDHIKPKSTHPELALDLNNMQVLCEDCNVGKINQWDTSWIGN